MIRAFLTDERPAALSRAQMMSKLRQENRLAKANVVAKFGFLYLGCAPRFWLAVYGFTASLCLLCDGHTD